MIGAALSSTEIRDQTIALALVLATEVRLSSTLILLTYDLRTESLTVNGWKPHKISFTRHWDY